LETGQNWGALCLWGFEFAQKGLSDKAGDIREGVSGVHRKVAMRTGKICSLKSFNRVALESARQVTPRFMLNILRKSSSGLDEIVESSGVTLLQS